MEAENSSLLPVIKTEKKNLEDNFNGIIGDDSLFFDPSTEVKVEPEFLDYDEFDANYSCQSKEKEKDSLSIGREHEKKDSQAPIVSCDKLYKYTNKTDDKHNENVNVECPSFICSECQRSFPFRSCLEVHMRTHTGEKPYTCGDCQRSFSRFHGLKMHLRTHTGEKQLTEENQYVCSKCSSKFSRSDRLKVHMRTHTGEKPFTCQVCQSNFSQLSHLKAHKRTHTGEKPYVCKHCPSSFSHPSNLKRHMQIHTGEKPFVCTKCPSSFSLSKHLKVHIRCHAE